MEKMSTFHSSAIEYIPPAETDCGYWATTSQSVIPIFFTICSYGEVNNGWELKQQSMWC